MRAWEMSRDLLRSAVPVVLDETEQDWKESAEAVGSKADSGIALFWKSSVPGSGAPDSSALAAIGAMENKGYVLPPYEQILSDGFAALEAGDMLALHVAHMRLWQVLRSAEPDADHPARQTARYRDWTEFDAAVDWPAAAAVPTRDAAYRDSIRGGWWAQIVGAAAGTALEGYTAERLAEKFGPILDYPRKPNTFNDDITYELCFLEAYAEKGPAVSGADIAERWVGLIPYGWSAEGIALDHLHRGVLPPDSGRLHNPFDEWIGAQMRGAICGMVVPGDVREAARLAWLDGEISHTSNGILGEVFNAMLCAAAFVQHDLRRLTRDIVGLTPPASEYGQVVRFALDACEQAGSWEDAWRACDERLAEYHWIHAYPNAAAQVVALWFGHEGFDRMLEIVCGCGHDVDCNAAQVLCAYAIAHGERSIPPRWTAPLGTDIHTYMRRPTRIAFDELVRQTVDAARKWRPGSHSIGPDTVSGPML